MRAFPASRQAFSVLMAVLSLTVAAMAQTESSLAPFHLSMMGDQKTGSVLIYNLYTSDASRPQFQNTDISLTNTHATMPVTVHVFFVDGASGQATDKFVSLLPKQTTSFLASEFDPGITGYVVAVAVNGGTGCPIGFNYLMGDAYFKFTIEGSPYHQANLGAQAFTAFFSGDLPGWDGSARTATLAFDGSSYDYAPRALMADGIASQAEGNKTLLVVNRLGGSLAAGSAVPSVGSVFGVLADDSERHFSYTFSSNVTQTRALLSNSFPRTSPPYGMIIPYGRAGWLRFWPVIDTGILGAVINFHPSSQMQNNAYGGGRNLHALTQASSVVLTIPVNSPGGAVDLAISKSHGGEFNIGTAGTYNIVVSNTGSSEAAGMVKVIDSLPANLTLQSYSGQGWSCTGSSVVICASIGPAANTSLPTLRLKVNIGAGTPGTVANTATLFYAGDTNAANDTATDTTTVTSKTIPTITLASSLNPSTAGQPATFTATLGGGGTPTGTLEFFDGNTLLGEGSLSGGVAALTTSALAAGVHQISAIYGGDATYASVISPILSQTVVLSPKLGAGVSLQSSLNPSSLGQEIEFIANVTGAGAGTPTGSVQFLDGTTPLGTIVLSAGSAGLKVSGLNAGPHSITANYQGDASFASAISPVLTQVVTLADPGIPYPTDTAFSDNKPGSVLFYNFYSSDTSNPNSHNTDLAVTNTHDVVTAYVRLYLVNGATGKAVESSIILAPRQTSSYLTSEIDPGGAGYAIAVAVDGTTGCPVKFNYLIGNEYIKLASGHMAGLPAQAFAAIASSPAVCPGGGRATLDFDGVNYDMAPRTVAIDTVASAADGTDTLVIVNPLGGTLSPGGGAATIGTIAGVIYDHIERGYTFSHSGGTQIRTSLSNSFPVTVPPFSQVIPFGISGWMKFQNTSDLPLLGAAIRLNSRSGAMGTSGSNLRALTLSAAGRIVIGGNNQVDLSIVETVSGDLATCATGEFTILVSNAAQAAPVEGVITVTDNLPANLTLAGFSGTGWSCTGIGTSAVSCSYSGGLAAGASLPNLILTINVGAGTPVGLGAITNTATVSAANQQDLVPGNNTVSIPANVVKIPVSETASSSAPSAVYGETITLTATIAPNAPYLGTPTGTAQFFDNGVPLGEAIALSGGSAVFATSSLLPGAHSISANYSGDACFAAAVSSNSIAINVIPAQDLVVTALTAPAEVFTDSAFDLGWVLRNQGGVRADGPWADRIYLSTDDQPGNDAQIAEFPFAQSLDPAQSAARTQVVSIPRSAIPSDGQYFLIVMTDAGNSVDEKNNENNNWRAAPIHVRRTLLPDLTVQSIEAPTTAFFDQEITVRWTVKNIGNGSTNASQWSDKILLSNDRIAGGDDAWQLQVLNVSYLNAGESYLGSATARVPRGLIGTHYIIVQTDCQNATVEENKDNNHLDRAITLQVPPMPDLQVTLVQAPEEVFAGQPLLVNWRVDNLGTGNTPIDQGNWFDGIYLSKETSFNQATARFLGNRKYDAGLAKDANYQVSGYQVTIPLDIAGDWYVFVIADYLDSVYEFTGENNNGNYDRRHGLRIRATPPDLIVTSLTAPATGTAASQVTVNWTVKNQGAFDAGPNWLDTIYLSSTPTLDPATAIPLRTEYRAASLAPGGTYSVTANVPLPPCTAGLYYLFVQADSGEQVFEYDPSLDAEMNNFSLAQAMTITSSPPDLQVISVTNPVSGNAAQTVSIGWMVENRGTSPTTTDIWVDRVYLSPTASFDANTALLLGSFSHTGTLAANASYAMAQNIRIPDKAVGSYYVFVMTDVFDAIEECSLENNNSGVGASTINVANVTPDLVISSISAQNNLLAGQTFTVQWIGQNEGMAAVSAGAWNDAVYLSSDQILDANDRRLAVRLVNGPLGIGATYQAQAQAIIPQVPAGDYYLIVKADGEDYVFEGTQENNNTNFVPVQITIPAVDLKVTAFSVPAVGYAGQTIPIFWVVVNDGAMPTLVSEWTDRVVLSRDQILDSTDPVIGYRVHLGALNQGESYSAPLDVNLPPGLTGQYYLFVRIDTGNDVVETIESNNTSIPQPIPLQLPPPANLTVISIGHPLTASPGEPAMIQWTVQNIGPHPATGKWRDAVYLSQDRSWDIGDTLIDRVEQGGPIPTGGTYAGYLTAPLPPVEPGQYYLIVRADVRNNVREDDEANNTSASSGTILIDVTELTLGVPHNSNIATGQERYYKVNVPGNETLRFLLDGLNPFTANELFARFGLMPSRSAFDFAYSRPNEPDQEIVVPNTQAGNYYSLARSAFVLSGASPDPFSIKAEIIPFSITSVSPNRMGDNGQVTITIKGARFEDGSIVRMIHDGTTLTADRVSLIDSATISARFTLINAMRGTYDLIIVNPGGGTATLEDGITVEQSDKNGVWTEISGSNTIRVGQKSTFIISYGNRGNVDAVGVPLWIAGIPLNSKYELGFELTKPPQIAGQPPVDWNEVPIHIEKDGEYQIPLLLPLIPPGTRRDLVVRIISSGPQEFELRAWVNPPFFNSPFNPETEDCITSVLSLALNVLGLKEYVGCMGAIADGIVSVVDSVTKPTEFALTQVLYQSVSIAWSVTWACGSSVPIPFNPLKIAKTILGVIQTAVSFIETVDKCANAFQQRNLKKHRIDAVVAIDPNDKVGPSGYAAQRFIGNQYHHLFQINFENIPAATGAAQRIRITDQLDSNLDPRTFRLREVGFGSYRVTVPENRAFYQGRLQLGPELGNILADITAGVDIATGQVTWTLTAIDPNTGEQPVSALLGLLPPNDQTGRGQGFVTYTIMPKAGTPTGTVISNNATIIFDTEEPITTNTVTNTLDAGAPTSTVSQLPASSLETFTVTWSGSDPAGGSGLRNFDIWYAVDGGSYQPWLTATAETSAQFTGQPGKQYRFYSIARDNAGNVEDAPSSADAETAVPQAQNPVPTLTSLVPASVMVGSPGFTLTIIGTDFVTGSTVNWNGSPRTTTYVSATQLNAAIPTTDLTGTGIFPITVFNPAPGGGTSSILNFTVSPPPTADLHMTKTALPNLVEAGSNISYTLTVANQGPAAAANVTVTDDLPEGTTFISCSSTGGGACSGVGRNRTISFGSLEAGASATITLVARINGSASGGSVVRNTATVSGATADPNQANNSATATTYIMVPDCVPPNCPEIGPGAQVPDTTLAGDQVAGSVLIYNLYSSSASNPNLENTLISLTNTDPGRMAVVHLFFIDGNYGAVADMTMCLTANQTVSFLASDVDPGTTGYLVMVAVDRQTGCPIKFNALIGEAFLKLASGHAANLGAEAFPAISATPGGSCDGNSASATIAFDGVHYSAAPKVLAVDSIPSPGDGNTTLLVVNGLNGDYASSVEPIGSISGLIFDDQEQGFSFTVTGGCQLKGLLSQNFPRTAPRFPQIVPIGRSGWMRFSAGDNRGLVGAIINFNTGVVGNPSAFRQGHNLHRLLLTTTSKLKIPLYPPSCW